MSPQNIIFFFYQFLDRFSVQLIFSFAFLEAILVITHHLLDNKKFYLSTSKKQQKKLYEALKHEIYRQTSFSFFVATFTGIYLLE